jgi:hypothetical protein
MSFSDARQLERGDRYVRRSYVRMGRNASRHRVAYWLEETLRLVSLPGENEGRVYYFRRVSLPSIPANASRKTWLEKMEQVLTSMAAQSVHASDPRAERTNVVFFHNYLDALEMLLHRLVKSESVREWFWPLVLGKRSDSSGTIQLAAVLNVLRELPVPTGVVANIIASALIDCDPVLFLSAVPFFTVRDWLRELESPAKISGVGTPIELPLRLQNLLKETVRHFGLDDIRTVWLASLVVLSVSSSLSTSTGVKRARATLRHTEKLMAPPLKVAESGDRTSDPRAIGFNDEPVNSLASCAELRIEEGSRSGQEQRTKKGSHLIEQAAAQSLLGEPTSAAGLYFLLNAMRQLRLPAALELSPELAESSFAAHILKSLAVHAGVAEDDPIFRGLGLDSQEFVLPASALAMLPSNSKLFPANIQEIRHVAFDSQRFLRLWTTSVRRWCWRMGKITVRHIVNRPGRIWLSRTDLDVTLPLRVADIRVRRIGLDIDPGWLPWFGKHGRVVRFHYEDQAAGGVAC